MSVLGRHTETLLSGLSSFWQTMFADRDQLNALYSGTETLLGQAYLDLLVQVLNVNLQEMPLFNKEYWKLFTVREDNVYYDPAHEYAYYTAAPRLVGAEFLLNRVYNPTVALERGIDFVVEAEKLRFNTNPFQGTLPGVASRTLEIAPTEYRRGQDGVFSLSTPQDFYVEGLVKTGTTAEVFGTNRVKVPGSTFAPTDVGRRLEVADPANPVTPFTGTITRVLDESTVHIDTTIPDVATGRTWRLLDTRVFYDYHVGHILQVEDPTVVESHVERTITAVASDGLTLTLDVPLPFSQNYRGVGWRHQSKRAVRELSFWIPDALFDLENLYLTFGYLINRYEPSSESYRALISGIFQYFMLGPAFSRLEAALNVMVGVPVTEQDGEVVLSVTPDSVTTSHRTYNLPAGSVRALAVGDTLRAFEPLTTIFTVTDYNQDPTWHHGKVIPQVLIDAQSVADRHVDPLLYDVSVGSPKPWYVGDPRTYVGADFTGEVLPWLEGNTGVVAQESGSGDIYITDVSVKATPKLIGHTFTAGGYSSTITRVEYHAGTTRIFVGGATDPIAALLLVPGPLQWRTYPRPALRHNVGFNLMQDYLKHHICYVSYDLNRYNIPYLHSRDDIQDVLLKGKPAHVYFMLSPTNYMEDTVYVAEDRLDLGFNLKETFAEVDPSLKVGPLWQVGAYYTFGGAPPNLTVDLGASDVVSSTTGVGIGDSTLYDANMLFDATHIAREVNIDVGTHIVRARVAELLDDNTVSLYDASDAGAAFVPVGSGYTYRFGAPRLTHTPVCVGGANPNINRGNLIGWPLLVTLSDGGYVGAAGVLPPGVGGPII